MLPPSPVSPPRLLSRPSPVCCFLPSLLLLKCKADWAVPPVRQAQQSKCGCIWGEKTNISLRAEPLRAAASDPCRFCQELASMSTRRHELAGLLQMEPFRETSTFIRLSSVCSDNWLHFHFTFVLFFHARSYSSVLWKPPSASQVFFLVGLFNINAHWLSMKNTFMLS